MKVSKQSAETILKIHGPEKLQPILKAKPEGARFIAISRYKCASIFYKNELGRFYADYRNGRNWEEVRQVNVRELTADLIGLDMVLCVIEDLECLIASLVALQPEPIQVFEEIANEDPLLELKSRVDSQFSRIGLRCNAEGDASGYWQGQYDAYETVQSMIRDLT